MIWIMILFLTWISCHSAPYNTHTNPSVHSLRYIENMMVREREIMKIQAINERWENWVQLIQQKIVPSFTSHGFKIQQIPTDVFTTLQYATMQHIQDINNLPYENFTSSVERIYFNRGLGPKFIQLGNVANEVHLALLRLHEEWAGIKLLPTSAYGVRVYQNTSSLVMHTDRVETHVISSILHISHHFDNPDHPWCLDIDDVQNGTMHSVCLEPGQMLLYESAKCLHGRRRALAGNHYASLFLHYKPADPHVWNFTISDVVNSVPRYWNKGVSEEEGSRFAGMAMTIDSLVADGAPSRNVPASRTNQEL